MIERQQPPEIPANQPPEAPMSYADSTHPTRYQSPSARHLPSVSFTPDEQNLTREQKDLLRLIQRTPKNLQRTGGANNASSRRRGRFS